MVDDPDCTGKVSRWRQLMAKELTGRPEGFADGNVLVSGRPYPSIME
jgi:hypothetical protein